MKKIIAFFGVSIALSACVSESEYERVVDEKNTLVTENQVLKSELEEIKYGAPTLFSDGKSSYEANDFSNAKEKFQTLLERHPNTQQAFEAKEYLEIIYEEELWQAALISDEMSNTEKYISSYPSGKYIKDAVVRKKELKQINMQRAYDEALNNNSSYAWKRFLDEYPDHRNRNFIKEKIIRLEVDEILGDRQTGNIPSLSSYGSSYSSNSSVEITNNTGCNLTVRYSGVDAKMIQIPSGGTRTVYLSSGNYKIAASACGANYAGTEDLHGSYGSTFYITTNRY